MGLDPLVEEEGSSAYFAGKDLEKQSNGYSVRSLLPNLYSNYGRSKEDFEKLLHDRDREIKQNEKYIKKMEPVWRSEASQQRAMLDHRDSAGSSQSKWNPKVGRFQKSSEKTVSEQQTKYVQKKRLIDEKIDKAKEKMGKQEERLKDLQETNKYFYRMTSPSPYMVAQQQYLRRLMEKRGVDTSSLTEVAKYLSKLNMPYDQNLVRNICQVAQPSRDSIMTCTPEMISKFVEKIRLERGIVKEKPYLGKQKQQSELTHAKKITTSQTK